MIWNVVWNRITWVLDSVKKEFCKQNHSNSGRFWKDISQPHQTSQNIHAYILRCSSSQAFQAAHHVQSVLMHLIAFENHQYLSNGVIPKILLSKLSGFQISIVAENSPRFLPGFTMNSKDIRMPQIYSSNFVFIQYNRRIETYEEIVNRCLHRRTFGNHWWWFPVDTIGFFCRIWKNVSIFFFFHFSFFMNNICFRSSHFV